MFSADSCSIFVNNIYQRQPSDKSYRVFVF